MLKRVCDKCGEKIEKEYYEFEITHRVNSGYLGPPYRIDLCPKCYKENFASIEEIKRG